MSLTREGNVSAPGVRRHRLTRGLRSSLGGLCIKTDDGTILAKREILVFRHRPCYALGMDAFAGTLFDLPEVDTKVDPKQGIITQARHSMSVFARMNRDMGGLFTQKQASLLMGVSKQRVAALVQDGRLKLHSFKIDGFNVGQYIAGTDIEAWLIDENRKCGRPSKVRMFVSGLRTK